jgi:1-deoxy-D-xylulose-5-phosphate reductoisomerase
LNKRIRFPEIAIVVAETINHLPNKDILSVETVLDADLSARMQAESIVEAFQMHYQQRTGEETP